MAIKIEVTSDLILSLYNRLNSLFPWQKRWYAQRFQRDRCLHKGRQIGADYYFALEAVLDACLTGRNKIFIEPAPSEPEDTFYSNAAQYAGHFLGLNIKSGTQIITFSNGAKIRFLPENHQGWACFNGDTYVSEWAWFRKPHDIMEIVSSVTMHEKWRRTYYSSRGDGDNGAGIVFSEKSYFYDVVPTQSYECGLDHVMKIDMMNLRGTEHYINQLYLCQLPRNQQH
ncbi:terminase large subunit domain-containing protein [Morganella morganii]|uniref:terminase large subunit domain-containing protein n=1 Tax=Morganella morganii TaxID=582 RepID=UPI0034E58EC9